MPRSQKNHKASFTVLEIMVCLLLIGIMGSFLGIECKSLFARHRFESSAHTFLRDLGRWRLLAMTSGCEVKGTICQKKGKVSIAWTPDFPLDGSEGPVSYDLPGVQQVDLDGREVVQYELRLFSTGRISSSGILRFTSQSKESLALDLQYPMQWVRHLHRKISQIPPPPVLKDPATL